MARTFSKTYTWEGGKTTTSFIDVSCGIAARGHRKGQPVRNVVFDGARPQDSWDAATEFQAWNITEEEMIAVFIKDGYAPYAPGNTFKSVTDLAKKNDKVVLHTQLETYIYKWTGSTLMSAPRGGVYVECSEPSDDLKARVVQTLVTNGDNTWKVSISK